MLDCHGLLNNMGYECICRHDGFIINTPFESPVDGSGLQLFIENHGNHYLITDYGMTARIASHHDINLTKARLKQIKRICGTPCPIDDDWLIMLTSSEKELPERLAAATQAMLAVSHSEKIWQPKPEMDIRFQQRVGKFLEQYASKQLTRAYQATGFSGHTYTIPFALDHDPIKLIQCVGQQSSRMNWNSSLIINSTLSDIKKNDESQRYQRYAILNDEGIIDTEEVNRVSLLLGDNAIVLPYSKNKDWIAGLIGKTALH